jgi:hypothetical protein
VTRSGRFSGDGPTTLVGNATMVEAAKKAIEEVAAEKAVVDKATTDKATTQEKADAEATTALAKEATLATTTKEAAVATLDPKSGAKRGSPSRGRSQA